MKSGQRTHVTIAEKADVIAPHLPTGAFSKGLLLDHATGLNAIDNAADADEILSHLVNTGVLFKLGPNIALWALLDTGL